MKMEETPASLRVPSAQLSVDRMSEEYHSKSPEKSSPSFPEDADDDDDGVMDFNRALSPSNEGPPQPPDPVRIPEQSQSTPLTTVNQSSLPSDDEMDAQKPTSDAHDTSMSFGGDTGEKKVHWTNRNILILLDRVEAHLEDFTVNKKHKAVWQAIGHEMEPLGFTTEHCYNKWKNLRRDVRLLVSNPLKVVRNADILRRVARLILIIYPNVDASTMQVNNDRPGFRSTPTTPQTKPAPNGPQADSPRHQSPFYGQTPNGFRMGQSMVAAKPAPNTALFSQNATPVSSAASLLSGAVKYTDVNGNEAKFDPSVSVAGSPMFNSAAFLMQSQLFNDLIRPQSKTQEEDSQGPGIHHRTHSPLVHGSGGVGSVNSDASQSSNVASLASSILSNLCSSGNSSNLLNTLVESLSGGQSSPASPANAAAAVAASAELSGVVERLRDEEAVHLRLTEMVAHLADELRAAGQRRQQALDQLASLVRTGHSLRGSVAAGTAAASEL